MQLLLVMLVMLPAWCCLCYQSIASKDGKPRRARPDAAAAATQLKAAPAPVVDRPMALGFLLD